MTSREGVADSHVVVGSAPPPGDIQIGMMDKKGQLEVEVIRARGLVQKPGSKSLPGRDRLSSSRSYPHIVVYIDLSIYIYSIEYSIV